MNSPAHSPIGFIAELRNRNWSLLPDVIVSYENQVKLFENSAFFPSLGLFAP